MMDQRLVFLHRLCAFGTLIGALAFAGAAFADFHTFQIEQIYSNADRTVQFIVLHETQGDDGQQFWTGHALSSTSAGVTNTFVFPHNLPSSLTSDKRVLVATQGFAALTLITPDFVVPDGFLGTGAGTLNYASVDEVAYTALPTNGASAINRLGSTIPNVATNYAGQSASVASGAPAAPDLNQQGFTGSWYEAATSGQGIEVEFYPNLVAPGTALVAGAWFTFDGAPTGGADRQGWYTFSGNGQSGSPNVPFKIYQNVGGNFNALPVTSSTVVGSGTLAFSTCATGTFTYAFTDGSGRAGMIPLTRITPNVTCATGRTTTTNPDFGFSGNWFDPATSGQGFLFEVNPLVRVLFVTWYTYAPSGEAAGAAGQRWFTAQASFTPGSRSIPVNLYETTGGLFNQVTNPAPVTAQVGTGTVTFASCASAQLQFNFTGGSSTGKSGMISLSRVGPVPAGCGP